MKYIQIFIVQPLFHNHPLTLVEIAINNNNHNPESGIKND